eukprot:403347989
MDLQKPAAYLQANRHHTKFKPFSTAISSLFILCLTLQLSHALIDDAVSQKTSIVSYSANPTLMFQHAYFDISFDDGGSLVQADEDALYQLSRKSSRSYNYFQYFKTFHVNKTTEKTYLNIDLEGYKVYGMCQNQGSLDYVIALHENTNQIRVMRLTYDIAYSLGTIKDYKVVDKESNLILTGDIKVDCKYNKKYRDVNTYVIGILGSYLEQNSLSSFYFAKFNTKYNLTEYFIKSEDPTVMEIPRTVRVDIDNSRIYLGIEINKNKYHGRTVYQPGALPGDDNSNVAIIGYSWNYGTRLWTTVIGNEQYMDTIADIECYGNNIYVVLNSFSTQFTTNSSQTDIYYYRLRSENGFIEKKDIYGSPSDDKALDLVVTYQGLHLLALINNPFLPHRDADKQWKTQNSKQNLAVILFDFEDQIVDVESYDMTLASAINPYPIRMFVTRVPNTIKQRYTFISHRSNLAVDKKGGLFITYFNDYDLVYGLNIGCGVSNCAKCSYKKTSKCLECNSGYLLWQHSCYASTCPSFSFQYNDQNGNAVDYCKDCHYSCKSCSGTSDEMCTSCCTNGICGSVFDRVPSLGKCDCPVGMKESNGICSFQCQLDLGASSATRCYPQCPFNSYPSLQYDQAAAQERTEYNAGASSACDLYTNHLKFDKSGKGLRLPGPANLQDIPKEFSIGFWVSPTILNTNSFFINAFGRVQVFTQSATKNILYKYMTGASTSVSPTYVSANQVMALSSWNYVAVSQREINNNNLMTYEIQLGMSTSNFGSVMNAGYSKTQPVVKYGYFQNMIYLGAFNDINPQSFSGYLKDVRVFTVYHGLAQMQDEAIRIYRYYSYDDPKLVAYWKLTETYTATDIQYTIYDLSSNQNNVSYSLLSEPDYPVYTSDTSKPLSLCYFHDVKTCRNLKYSTIPPIATSSRKFMQVLTRMQDSLLVQSVGDIMYILPNNTDCKKTQFTIANITYVSALLGWQVLNDTLNPLYLPEGKHYQLCYYDSSFDDSFNMAQIYIAKRPRTVDPSTGHIYNRTDNQLQWMTGEGDQTQGDLIRFSYDCDQPVVNETEMIRSNNPSYDKIYILNTFNITGDFFFCWYPVFMQDYTPLPIYDDIHSLKYKIQYEPTLSGTFRTIGSVNEDIFQLDIKGTFVEGDQFIMTWKGLSYSDCNPTNQMGDVYYYNHSNWPSIWVGYGTGIHGVNMTQMDEVQACWKPGADMAPNVYIRMKKDDLSTYLMRLMNYNVISNQRAPELISFDPPYGSAVLTETDRTIKFNFKGQQVIPSSDGAGNLGKIIIYRGALKQDGTFIKTSQVLWQNIALNENTLPDPFQQGDLICTQTGQCSIILSQDSNRMKAGEIFYLTFYSYSFLTFFGSSRYYLFNTKYPVNTPVYDHQFICRSFDVYPSDAIVNGNTLVINGIDLRSKVIKAKWLGNNIVADTFSTKAINIRLKVYNTDTYFCTFNRPTSTVAIEDVTQNKITIKNLELRQCNEGSLFAEYIEVIRGIRDQDGQFTYVRSEKMYNVQLGTIGCHQSCSVCNGTSDNNCQICTSPTDFLLNGKCYSTCPAEAPYISTYSITHQNLLKSQSICVKNCPFGYFSDSETKICTECNPDCLTCTSAIIASCTSCNPNKQLFNGICVEDCPTPHHSNNYTSYVCNQIDQPKYLQVKIMSLGFINRIPKDKQVFLKVDINNTGGGDITGIMWSQLEPDTSSNAEINIFASNSDTQHDYTAQVVSLNNNALMKISQTQVVKVRCVVSNSKGDVAYDIYEFFLNDSPFLGDIAITKVGEPSNSTGTSVDTVWRIDLTNWYDSPDDSVQMLKLKVFVIRNYKVGLNSQTQQYTLTDQVSDNTLFVRLPPFAFDKTLQQQMIQNDLYIPPSMYKANVTICVMAEDIYYAQATKCRDFNSIINKIEFSSNYTMITEYVKNNLLISTNISNLLFATNMIFQAVQSPLRPNSQEGICTLDIHCNYNGVCNSELGIQKCECNQGYFGTYCMFQGNELQKLRSISTLIVDTTQARMKSKVQLKPFDLEIIANVVRGLLNSPDLVDDETFIKIIELLETASSSNFYSYKPLDSNNTAILIEGYSNALVKINHSFKNRRAMKDTLLLGMGLNLQQYTNSFQLSSNPADLSSLLSHQYYVSDDQKPYLIGGITSPRKRKLFMQEAELALYEEWGRRVDFSFHEFVQQIMLKMDPLNNQIGMRTKAFEFVLNHKKSTQFIGKTFVRSKDAYWNFPTTIWDNQPGVASKKHEIRQKIVKHIMNPFKFERNLGANLESNITTVEFFSVNNNKISVDLSSTSTFVDYREPFNKTRGFEDEQLRCMAWDEVNNEFQNDGSCTYSKIWEVIPCSDCDQYNQINTTVSTDTGKSPGIYSDFFAMKYWSESFGYLATIAGLCCFAAGHVFIWIIDRRMQHNLIVKLREKTRRFELQHGGQMLRKDGLFFNKSQLGIQGDQKTSKIASKKKVYLKQNQDDVQGLMGGDSTIIKQQENIAYGYDEEIKEQGSRPRRRVKSNKMYGDDEELDYGSDDSKIEERDAYTNVFKRKGRGRQNKQKNNFKIGGDFDENDRIIMQRLEEEKRRKLMKKFNIDDEHERKRDTSNMNPLQKQQYERHQKVMGTLKAEMTAQQLYHKLMELKYQDVEGMTKREFRSRIMYHVKRLPRDLASDVKSFLSEIRGQLNSTDEEMYLNMQDLFIAERERRELHMFNLKNMVIHGSFLYSLFFVTSLLSPRHIRWSLFFCNVVMLWFICAVFFNNTKDPLAVPDFSKKASSLAIKDIWISFVAPLGSTILMYILASFLKMPNSQLLNVVTLRQLEASLIEYRKESMIRFIMGYIIVFVIMGVIFWYVINFTATFGWKVSWIWWYAGIAAIFLQFAFVDAIFSIVNYYVFRLHKKTGRLCLKIRSVTQGYNELFEISDTEEKKIREKSKKNKNNTLTQGDNNNLQNGHDPENPPIIVQNLQQHPNIVVLGIDDSVYGPGDDIGGVQKQGTAGSGGSGGSNGAGIGDADALTGHTQENQSPDIIANSKAPASKAKKKKKKLNKN